MNVDLEILSLIIQEELKKKKLRESKEYEMPTISYEEDYEDSPAPMDEPKEERGVVVIDI